jgi:hypothetical protein
VAAKLGDGESRKEIVRDLGDVDVYVQRSAFEDACYVGGKDVIVGIAQQLFDKRPGGRPVVRNESGAEELVNDEVFPAPRYSAVIALSGLVEDASAPRIDLNRITYREEDVDAWRKWWEKNKGTYVVKSDISDVSQQDTNAPAR